MVVDVGANIGFYTILMAHKVGPSGRVYAFEPDPMNLGLLKMNLLLNNLQNVQVCEAAVSQSEGTAHLYLSPDNFGDHRLHPDQQESREKLEIKTVSLDEFLTREEQLANVRLLKLDTQGCEPLVLAGAQSVLEQSQPTLFLEYWPHGYREAGLSGEAMLQELRGVYGELLFIHELRQRFFSVSDSFIERICSQHEGFLHCNLLCSLKDLDQIREDLVNSLKG